MIKIYHNPRCSKSRQTLELLKSKVEDIEVVDYLKTPLQEQELKEVIAYLGIKPEELVRKKEQIFKDEYKGKQLDDNEWIKAMIEHPKLMERPIVVNGNKAAIGRPPEDVLNIL